MTSLMSSLFLKLYLNSLGIIETSSGLPKKSSAIFGHLWKSSENVRECLPGLCNNFENQKSSESGRKSSENHQKRRHY